MTYNPGSILKVPPEQRSRRELREFGWTHASLLVSPFLLAPLTFLIAELPLVGGLLLFLFIPILVGLPCLGLYLMWRYGSYSSARKLIAIAPFAALLIVSCNPFATDQPIPADCVESLFAGFDSRLSLEIAGRLPADSGEARDLLVSQGSPIVLTSSALFALKESGSSGSNNILARFVGDELTELADDEGEFPGDAKLVLSSSDYPYIRATGHNIAIKPGTDPVFEYVLSPIAESATAVLVNDGADTYLMVGQGDGVARYVALNRAAETFPIAEIEGWHTAASWNSEGLVAAVGPSLFTWHAKDATMHRLASDNAFLEARDVSLIAPGKAVVCLRSMVTLITAENWLVLAGIPALSYWDGTNLYLLDMRAGIVWRVAGVENLGSTEDDLRHADQLLIDAAKSETPHNYPGYKEASRILGCEEAYGKLAEVLEQ